MPPLPATPADRLLRAAEARDRADKLNDPKARQTALLIARGDERLAKSAECLARLKLPMDSIEIEPPE
jgi:hypothetical protein